MVKDQTKTNKLMSVELKGKKIKFLEHEEFGGPNWYYRNGEEKINVDMKDGEKECYIGGSEGIYFALSYSYVGESFVIEATIRNESDQVFTPTSCGITLGIDTYLSTYPEWNNQYFPTLLRCEKDHFWGYFMSPIGDLISVTVDSPVASWSHNYNRVNGFGGHRIWSSNIDVINALPLPERHPQMCYKLESQEERKWKIVLNRVDSIEELTTQVAKNNDAPMIQMKKYCYEIGEHVEFDVISSRKCLVAVVSPKGSTKTIEANEGLYSFSLDTVGVYTITLRGNRESEVKIYCRNDWSWYMKQARRWAVEIPQKASTHLESWYGIYSAMLAAKHFSDELLDELAFKHFNEILPRMYDIEKYEPIAIPKRICNHSSMIGLLTDVYETYDEIKYLEIASGLADCLLDTQGADGAYRTQTGWGSGREDSLGEHYTSVLYMAKSMMELAVVERKLVSSDALWADRYKRHRKSIQRAIDDLCKRLDDIGTEGEHTFEDGMISCSALQIGYYALAFADEENRDKYVEAAKYLMDKHRCLEQKLIPDCRMNGSTLRFWEAQYDVLIGKNMMNSPHGWTSWKTYATYYLYLLTGEVDYLRTTMNTLGACMQVVDSKSGDLRWAFVTDPFVDTYIWEENPQVKGQGVKKNKVFGESYLNMISSWYRADENKAFVEHDHTIYGKDTLKSDGWSCDNDVHEHFKCLEEVALTSAYVYVSEEGVVESWNCSVEIEENTLRINASEDCVEKVHCNLGIECVVHIEEFEHWQSKQLGIGMHWLRNV